ncbi:DUF2812 domain-containing protein [Alkalicoccobacillus plakortidis]|uniref:DUF2812 domain-containing protein n=1 Tax=Alkalicoccobacillus plakortidis TaxID=444060 RepID=A0ABT0XG86_9BACI|nr:DUF2812 domain-containing protein [Alkalicoccobacillus plakortidis]MCM2674897.1 DUF2812 domain-containing protein [Alkalicoccobacillus plakortidis]
MRRFKYFWNFTDEEQWLNEMARDGKHFMYRSFGYRFEKGEPKDTTYKTDYRMFKKKADFDDYEMLFEDSGWQRLPCPRRNGHQYFKRVRDDASDDIFSDQTSKAARYKRLSELFYNQFIMFLPILVVFIFTNNNLNALNLMNPIDWYLTPELWERTGSAFWRAFLFETPFALLRGLTFYLVLFCFLFYGYYYWKAKKQYEKESKIF